MSTLTCSAHAQFAGYALYVSPNDTSEVYAVENGVFGGTAPIGEYQFRPVIWTSLSESPSDLSPQLVLNGGVVNVIRDGHQYGSWFGRATKWSGSSASYVDLHPAGFLTSQILAAHSGRQGGTINAGQAAHAALWTGQGSNVIDLHVPGHQFSRVSAMTATHQGGQVDLPGIDGQHAAMWSGSAASFVDMNPPGRDVSEILGMHGNQQVGWAKGGPGTVDRAALWSGTPESYIDMHPFTDGMSKLLATCGSAQVGNVISSATGSIAGIWFGTPGSFINLDQFLPPGFGSSQATCIEERNGVYTIGGYARFGFYDQAVAWVGVPAPGSWALLFVLAPRRRRR